jgi:hypothetical protein
MQVWGVVPDRYVCWDVGSALSLRSSVSMSKLMKSDAGQQIASCGTFLFQTYKRGGSQVHMLSDWRHSHGEAVQVSTQCHVPYSPTHDAGMLTL